VSTAKDESGLGLFLAFLADFRSVLGVTSKGILLAPLAAVLVQTGPPWPAISTTVALTTVVELGVLLAAFQRFRQHPPRSAPGLFVLGAAVTLVAYLALHSALVFYDYQNAANVGGFRLRPEIRSRLSLDFTEQVALSESHFEPLRVYVPWSVHLARVALLSDWLLLTAMVAVFFASVLMRVRQVTVKVRAT